MNSKLSLNKLIRGCRISQVSCLITLLLLGLLLIFSTKAFKSQSVVGPAVPSTKRLDRIIQFKCILRECTSEHKQKHGDLFASFEPVWSGCYGDFYLMAFDNANASRYTLLDVGSNKAYAVATWFAFFLPELNINQATLYNYLMTTGKLTYTCGSCDDCRDKPFERKNTKQKVILDIHAFEPQPDTVTVLKGAQAWMNISGKDKSTLNIYGMAISNYIGKTAFKKCNPGNEVCSLDISQTSAREQVEIDVMTLDGFADKHNLAMIDVIKIDTEGYEPWVFQGAQRLLQEHRIRLFIFEHLKIAAWLNTTLQAEVAKFNDIGYVCYVIGKTGVILVSNCWSAKFDVRHNNLLCVSSKDRTLLNSIDQMRLPGTVPATCEKTAIPFDQKLS